MHTIAETSIPDPAACRFASANAAATDQRSADALWCVCLVPLAMIGYVGYRCGGIGGAVVAVVMTVGMLCAAAWFSAAATEERRTR